MGSDDIFKRQKAKRKPRGYAFRQPKANSYLIVTEGKRTEPLYFEGLKKKIEEKMGGNLDVYEVPQIEISGEGRSTNALINKAEELVSKSKILYQNIWIVFDKDDFVDFDLAIKNAEKKGYKVAWSNQSFEYWLYLHFAYSDTALHRNEWNRKLSEIFKEYKLGKGKYTKNDKNIYLLVDTFDGVNTAIRNAKRRMSAYEKGDIKPSNYDPGTTVYKLMEELLEYLAE